MKRVTYISLLLAFFFSFAGCSTKGQIQGEDYLRNVFLKNDMHKDLILFFPSRDSKVLIPEERFVNVKGSVEKAIVDEILKGPLAEGSIKTVVNKGDVVSVVKKEDTVTVSLSTGYLSSSKSTVHDEMSLYAIVNSLTELPEVKRVVFKTKGKNLTVLNTGKLLNSPISRNRNVLKRNCSLNPSEVLKLQMTYEQQGEWLDAYIMMSDDENNINRKSYDDYVREMLEVSENGFTDQKFSVGEYKIDENGSTASVKVDFHTKDASEDEKIEDFYFNCVKIDNMWMVDWLTAQ